MKSVKKYFDVQMGLDICAPAREKLFKKLLPNMCVEHDICPLCSADLEIDDFISAAFVNAGKKCVECDAVFKGDKSYGRSDIKSKAFISGR